MASDEENFIFKLDVDLIPGNEIESAHVDPKVAKIKNRKRWRKKAKKSGQCSDSIVNGEAPKEKAESGSLESEAVDVETEKSEKRTKTAPNWFLALQITDESILQKFSAVQEHIVEKEPRLKSACVPVNKTHLTLMVFHAKDDQISELEALIEESVSEFRSEKEEPIAVKVKGLDNFRHEVVFAKVDFLESDGQSRFTLLWTSLASRLLSSGFLKSRDANIADFKRHVTLLKMSRAKNLKKLKLKKISEELYSTLAEEIFGNDSFHSVQLLSMTKPVCKTTGYYFCQREFPFSSPVEKASHPLLAEAGSRKLSNDLAEEKIKIRQAILDAIFQNKNFGLTSTQKVPEMGASCSQDKPENSDEPSILDD